jgi:hypothetical protein
MVVHANRHSQHCVMRHHSVVLDGIFSFVLLSCSVRKQPHEYHSYQPATNRSDRGRCVSRLMIIESGLRLRRMKEEKTKWLLLLLLLLLSSSSYLLYLSYFYPIFLVVVILIKNSAKMLSYAPLPPRFTRSLHQNFTKCPVFGFLKAGYVSVCGGSQMHTQVARQPHEKNHKKDWNTDGLWCPKLVFKNEDLKVWTALKGLKIGSGGGLGNSVRDCVQPSDYKRDGQQGYRWNSGAAVLRLPLGPHTPVSYRATVYETVTTELDFTEHRSFKSLSPIIKCTKNVIITSSRFCRFLAKCMRDRKHYGRLQWVDIRRIWTVWSQAMLVILRCWTFCLPGCYPTIQIFRYTEL